MSIEKEIPIKEVGMHLPLNQREYYDSLGDEAADKDFYLYYYPTGNPELDKYLEKQFKQEDN